VSDWIDPDALIRQAKELVDIGAGRGRPRTSKGIDHRRAVSASYYALFHELIWQAVKQALPQATDEERRAAARWVDHADLKAVCGWVKQCAAVTQSAQGTPGGVKEQIWPLLSVSDPLGGRVSAVPPSLDRIAASFIALLDARHDADYNHLVSFPKPKAVSHVLEAESAVGNLRANLTDPYVAKFLVLLLARASRLK